VIRRASAGWLIGAVILLTGVAVVVVLVPLLPCRTCEGLARVLWERTSPSIPPAPRPRLDCPDCDDGGKVSYLRSRRPPTISEPICGLLRSFRDKSTPFFLNDLINLITKDGKDIGTFYLAIEARSRVAHLRFIQAEGKDYLLILIEYSGISMRDYSLAGTILISPDGHVLDCIWLWCETIGVELFAEVPEKSAADGAGLLIVPTDRDSATLGATPFDYTLEQWEHRKHRGVYSRNESTGRDGFCRIRIVNDRMDVLMPKTK
jgi:hypothetical protein